MNNFIKRGMAAILGACFALACIVGPPLTAFAGTNDFVTTGGPDANQSDIKGAKGWAGIQTPKAGIAAAGGYSTSPRMWATGDAPARISTDGTDTTPVVTETYLAEIFAPCNATVTGIALFNGSAVAGNVKLAIYSTAGIALASTASTAQAGTDAYQRVALSAAYSIKGPATYVIGAQFNNTSARFNSHVFGNFGASKKTGEVFGTLTTITPPTTFTTGVGPIASLY